MKHPTILLVEDDRNDEELIRLSLTDCKIKHELVVQRDGEEALDFLLSKEAIFPVLILLDLKLPKFSGLEVLKKLREEASTRHLPVVVFTSSKEEKDIRESYRLGANAFVRKPIEFTEFSETVKSIGTFWLQLNQVSSPLA